MSGVMEAGMEERRGNALRRAGRSPGGRPGGALERAAQGGGGPAHLHAARVGEAEVDPQPDPGVHDVRCVARCRSRSGARRWDRGGDEGQVQVPGVERFAKAAGGAPVRPL